MFTELILKLCMLRLLELWTTLPKNIVELGDDYKHKCVCIWGIFLLIMYRNDIKTMRTQIRKSNFSQLGDFLFIGRIFNTINQNCNIKMANLSTYATLRTNKNKIIQKITNKTQCFYKQSFTSV